MDLWIVNLITLLNGVESGGGDRCVELGWRAVRGRKEE